jgi:hypothetical protein
MAILAISSCFINVKTGLIAKILCLERTFANFDESFADKREIGHREINHD